MVKFKVGSIIQGVRTKSIYKVLFSTEVCLRVITLLDISDGFFEDEGYNTLNIIPHKISRFYA